MRLQRLLMLQVEKPGLYFLQTVLGGQRFEASQYLAIRPHPAVNGSWRMKILNLTSETKSVEMRGLEPRTLYMQSTRSTAELHLRFSTAKDSHNNDSL